MRSVLPARLVKEERLVAELAHLGITYLSRSTSESVDSHREDSQLLADLIRQPSSRVRTSLISVLLEHPEFKAYTPETVKNFRSKDRLRFNLFYTAAVYLQRIYENEFQRCSGKTFQWLPDFFSTEFGIEENLSAENKLEELSKRHKILTGETINWAGTYQNAVIKLLRSKKMEMRWNQSAGNL